MTSQPSGPASSSPSWVLRCPCRRSESLRLTDLPGTDAGTAVRASALDVGPGLDPLRVVRALVATAVAAAADRRRPEGHAVEVRHVGLVEDLAVVLHGCVLARLAVCRRLAEPLGHLRLDLRRGDPVHPLVHAVRMLGLR